MIITLPKKLFIYKITNRGLFSELNNLLIAKIYADKNHYDFKIDISTRDGLEGDLYFSENIDTYFNTKEIQNYRDDIKYEEIKISEGFGQWIQDDPGWLTFTMIRSKKHSFIETKKISDSMPFSENALVDINKNIKTLGLPRDYYFFHIRRGDKLISEAKLIHFKEFFVKIKDLEDQRDPIDIYIATDDYGVITEAYDYLSSLKIENIKIHHLIQPNILGHSTDLMNNNNIKFTYEQVIQLLTEVEISRHAVKTICTFSSNIGRYLKLVNDNPKSVMSLDSGWFSG